MTELSELAILAILLISSVIASEISVRLKIPSVIGPLLVGVLVGPSVLGLVHQTDVLSFVSEIGVMGLMFLAGLESDLHLLKRYLKPSLLVALFGAIVPVATFYYLCVTLGGVSNSTGIFYGITFAAMSTSITVNVLKEKNKMKSKNGVTIIGAAVVDDILAMLLLGIYLAVFAPKTANSSPNLLVTIVLDILFFVFAFLSVQFIVPWVMQHVVPKLKFKQQSNVVTGWFIMLFMAAVAVQLGLSAIIGAFFAGVAIGQTVVNEEIEKAADSAQYGLFIPVFLTTVGLGVNVSVLKDAWLLILAMTFLAVITKLVGSGLGAKLSGYGWLDSAIVGAGTIPRGEFSIVIAQIGLNAKIIDSTVYSELLLVIILATILGPVILSSLFAIENKRKTTK